MDQKACFLDAVKRKHFLVLQSTRNLPGLPGWLVAKESTSKAGDAGDTVLIPGSRRSPGEGDGNPLQYSCLENSIYRGTWWTTVHGVSKQSDTTEAAEHAHTSLPRPDFRFLTLVSHLHPTN